MTKYLLTSSLIVLSLASLSGCETITNPTFMPAGYTYHQNTYKAPTGPKPWGIGYEYSAEKNAEIIGIWRNTAEGFLTELETVSNIRPSEVYLAQPELDNAFTYSFDYALREALRTRGYTLLSMATPQSVTLIPGSYDPEFKDAMRGFAYNDQNDPDLGRHAAPKQISKDIVLTIKAIKGAQELGVLEGTYNMPLYGYEDAQLYFPLTHNISEVWR